jgi:hypothetical protein
LLILARGLFIQNPPPIFSHKGTRKEGSWEDRKLRRWEKARKREENNAHQPSQ